MKILLLTICAIIGMSQQVNFNKLLEDFEDEVEKEAKQCYADFHINRQQLDSMLKVLYLPDDRNLKCFLACTYLHFNVADETGALTNKIKDYIDVDEPIIEKMLSICKDIEGNDVCEKVFNEINCLRRVVKEF
ncbi:hypothetical protein FQA39_LY13762 [Lamprigera yunnana]|nr:hypothetical protein FQA39_LY13762 [Lamprigera yunnana]